MESLPVSGRSAPRSRQLLPDVPLQNHIAMHLNWAVDEVRRAEILRLPVAGKATAQRLKHLRWPLLRRDSRERERTRRKLNALLDSKIQPNPTRRFC